MNFNQLLIFHKVAELRHFTRAAEALFISQPAVSKQVQQLEKALKQPLFTQVGQKVYLTEAGKLLYEYAGRIFALADEAELALNEMQRLERGRLALGASTTIGTYLLPELLGRYKALYPAMDLVVEIANTEEIQSKLLAHRLEVGLVEGGVTHSELLESVWRQDELVLITSVHFEQVDGEELTISAVSRATPAVYLTGAGIGNTVGTGESAGRSRCGSTPPDYGVGQHRSDQAGGGSRPGSFICVRAYHSNGSRSRASQARCTARFRRAKAALHRAHEGEAALEGGAGLSPTDRNDGLSLGHGTDTKSKDALTARSPASRTLAGTRRLWNSPLPRHVAAA